ncbi:RxLR effector protein [Phytophthora megakarya]|uniref:RxLR effector protein n=1 Tax=Phytophthora megakarya TaxID=4795 RepID=A0A225V8R0_9STRA|nr:RxLR effector protein [Phytophthora megakarya]
MIDGFVDNFKNRYLVPMFKTAQDNPNTEKLATKLQDALIDKWMAEGLKPDELKRMLSGVDSAEMIERYVKKLAG